MEVKTGKKALTTIVVFVVIIAVIAGQDVIRKLELRALLNTTVITEDKYTPNSFQQYTEILERAKEVSRDIFADEATIDDAYVGLQNSLDCLELRPDKSGLKEKVSDASVVEQGLYTPATFDALILAVNQGNIVLADDNAVEEDVVAASNNIDLALAQLVKRPDKAELISACDKAQIVDASLYLPATFSRVRDAIMTANSVIANENAVAAEVDAAIKQLKNSIASLIVKPDKTELTALIDRAAHCAEDQFTTTTFDTLQDSVLAARLVAENENATQAEVISVQETLQSAIDDLAVTTKGIFRIRVSFSRLATNHVGSSWSKDAFYNGASIGGETVTMQYGSGISIYCQIIENDNVPDVGAGYIWLTMQDDAKQTITIYVRENRGRYAGNLAVWEVTATAILIERV